MPSCKTTWNTQINKSKLDDFHRIVSGTEFYTKYISGDDLSKLAQIMPVSFSKDESPELENLLYSWRKIIKSHLEDYDEMTVSQIVADKNYGSLTVERTDWSDVDWSAFFLAFTLLRKLIGDWQIRNHVYVLKPI